MAFDLEHKVSWDELTPSLQLLFGHLQNQITDNKNEITNLWEDSDRQQEEIDDLKNRVYNLEIVQHDVEIIGEQDGYPIAIRKINMKDGKQLIEQYFAKLITTSYSGGNPECGRVIPFPQAMDRVICIVRDPIYRSGKLGYIDGDWWINEASINGAGFAIHYDSVHETNNNHNFICHFHVLGYILTGEVPDLPEEPETPPDQGTSGEEVDEKLKALIPIGTLRWCYVAPSEDWLVCQGQVISRTEYKDLWDFAQKSGLVVDEASWNSTYRGKFGVGDGSTTFRLPDFRAVVINGLDTGRNIDPGRILGSEQLPTNTSNIDPQNLLSVLNRCVAVRSNNQVGGSENWVSNLPTFADSWEYFKKPEGNRHAYYRNQFGLIPGTYSTKEKDTKNVTATENAVRNISMNMFIKAK